MTAAMNRPATTMHGTLPVLAAAANAAHRRQDFAEFLSTVSDLDLPMLADQVQMMNQEIGNEQTSRAFRDRLGQFVEPPLAEVEKRLSANREAATEPAPELPDAPHNERDEDDGAGDGAVPELPDVPHNQAPDAAEQKPSPYPRGGEPDGDDPTA